MNQLNHFLHLQRSLLGHSLVKKVQLTIQTIHATNYNDLYYLFYCESKATMAIALVLIYSR